ncbi:hypothetical protein ACTZGS_27140, partial [Pseudomonas paraglycinae]
DFFNNFNHLRFRSLVSGRRILQRYTLLSTPLFSAFDREDREDRTVESARQTGISNSSQASMN